MKKVEKRQDTTAARGRRLIVPNIEVFLCLGLMIITFKKINK